jgi:type IV pilus assembly protein PilY1
VTKGFAGMSKFSNALRSLAISLPILVVSSIAIFGASAQITSVTIPSGQISTQNMSDFTSYPNGSKVGAKKVPPVAMIVASTDEQLFYKAYTDYTDMTGKGSPDVTYNNSFVYQGYFNPDVCYDYSGSVFAPVAAAANHACSGKYSGNFMNWATMSRLDILRYAMYGGLRTTDDASTTVLSRAIIPNDGHAWVKVYTGTDVASYVKSVSGNTISLCNATTGTLSSATYTSSGLHLVSGTYTQWASMEVSQCGTSSTDKNAPSSGVTDLVLSVKVCDGTWDTRSICKLYGASSLKPTGVLQQFGQSDSAQQISFALMSGSRTTPRSGGILRKNASFIEGNLSDAGTVDHSCGTKSNEVNFSNGTFCKGNKEGIINNLSLISLNATGNYWDGGKWQGCGNYGIYNRYPDFSVNGALDNPGNSSSATQYHCGAWGNPVGEMYGEALRYMSGATSATAGFASADDGLGMSIPAWSPPITDTNWCASCAIVLISSGQVTFDSDEIPDLTSVLQKGASTATDSIGANEGINSGSYIVGRMLSGANDLAVGNNVNTTSDVCQPQTVSKFSLVRGICPDGASMEGSYLLSGEAWQAWVNGITLAKVTDSTQKIKPVKTYSVALSESMPTFSVPTGAGTVTLAPLCQSSNSNPGTAPVETGSADSYRTCGLLALQLGQITSQVGTKFVYGQPFATDGTRGSFTVIWDDSTWGNDHDLDVTSLVSWCVGTACGATGDNSSTPSNFCWNTNVRDATSAVGTVSNSTSAVCQSGHLKKPIGPNQVLVRTEVLTANAGNDLSLGFSVSGTSTGDGIHRTFYRRGDSPSNNSPNQTLITGTSTYPKAWTPVQVEVFTPSGSTASNTLQNPLWYAAKYGGFTYQSSGVGKPAATSDDLPSQAGQWQGTDGNPSNYFLARNPSALVAGLQNAFQQIADSGSSADNFGNATTPSSSNDISGNGLAYQVQYFQQKLGVSWVGGLKAFWSDDNGYQRESTTASGNQVLDSGADYVVSGKDISAGALPNGTASYRCTSEPVSPDGTSPFDPSASSDCLIVSASNSLKPVWDASTLLDAYYDPSAADGTADAKAIANLSKQRIYSGDAGSGDNIGQRYIFTYLTKALNAANASAALTIGTQTDFVWNDCSATGIYTLSQTSGFCGTYDASNAVRTGNYSLLNEKDPGLAQKLVNWVRGAEDTADYRDRSSGVTTGKNTYRLGDIVDSSPMIVGTPAEAYDILYSDFSYAAFRANYGNRRQMIYVGANDGMLHAFNGGFYVPAQPANGTAPATDPTVYRQLPSALGLTSGDSGAPAGNNWTLGQEAWAFVPNNLLPHLRWLADKNYTHVFYVDGSPVVTDAQIFKTQAVTGSSSTCQSGAPAAADIDAQGHVCGWGTVMVVPFRLGGGAISVDTVGAGKPTDTQASNSAYVLLDVTDPEKPPTVLGEITTGTFTTSEPSFAVHKSADGSLHFLLAIGSGPADNGGIGDSAATGGTNDAADTKPVAAPAGKNLQVWVYDLADIQSEQGSSTPVTTPAPISGGPADSFAGDMIASDFNLNYSDEGIYFGVVTNPPPQPNPPPNPPLPQTYSGGLYKINMNTGVAATPDSSDAGSFTLERVIATDQPVTIRPTVATDSAGRPMVYFGTGRSYTPDDDSGSTQQGVQQQYIYGVSDNSLLTSMPAACQVMPSVPTLFDASPVDVAADANNSITGLPSTVGNVSTLSNLENLLLATSTDTDNCYDYSGWKLALASGDSGTAKAPSERVVSSQTLLGGVLLTPSYVPPSKAMVDASGSSDCDPIPVPGTSNLYGLNYLTGTADPHLMSTFGMKGTNISRSIALGSGKASAPVLHSSGGNVKAAFGLSGGTILKGIGTFNAAKNGEISWREPGDNQ